MWKNIVERGRPQMTIWRMCIACWISKATEAHSEYVILIALPLQQWLHERVWMLRYTYIACLLLHTYIRTRAGWNGLSIVCRGRWTLDFNRLKPSGYYMYHQLNTQQFSVLPTQCIYVFCVDLRTNSDYFPIQI